jgi:hypothetical protein
MQPMKDALSMVAPHLALYLSDGNIAAGLGLQTLRSSSRKT